MKREVFTVASISFITVAIIMITFTLNYPTPYSAIKTLSEALKFMTMLIVAITILIIEIIALILTKQKKVKARDFK